MSILLNIKNVRTLVSPTGTHDPLVQALYVRQYHKTLVSLYQLYQKLLNESPKLAESSGFAQAFKIVSELPSSVQKQVFIYPSARFWLDVAWDLVRRRSHILFPDMHIRTHLDAFWKCVLAASTI